MSSPCKMRQIINTTKWAQRMRVTSIFWYILHVKSRKYTWHPPESKSATYCIGMGWTCRQYLGAKGKEVSVRTWAKQHWEIDWSRVIGKKLSNSKICFSGLQTIYCQLHIMANCQLPFQSQRSHGTIAKGSLWSPLF